MLTKADPTIIEKWLPLIEGSGDWKPFVSSCPKIKATDYDMMAILFENIDIMGKQELTEATVSSNTGTYSPILIPMLRRVMPALIGPQIFGTQPLQGPSGLIFALKAVLQNDSINTITQSNSCILTLASTTGFSVGGDCSTTADAAVGKIRHIDGNNMLVEVISGTFVAAANIDNAVTFSATATTISAVYDNEALLHIIFPTYTGTYTTAVGEALSTNMKEVGFTIDTATATAKTRKLKAKWTHELEQDLKAIHSMDAETLLSTIASDEVIMEMNREFIDLLIANINSTTAYNYTTADGRWELEKYQNLMTMISRVKHAIALLNKRGLATFMIVSASIKAILESSGKLDTTGVDPIQNVFAGTALGLKVFVDIYAANDTIYLGYKGPTEIDAGLFYSPYIPLQIRRGMGEEDGQPRTFFSTRYALTANPFGASNYYKAISVANVPA